MRARPVDATPVACVLHPDAPIEQDLLAQLAEHFPLPGIDTACPVLPPEANGAAALGPLVAACAVLEPVTIAARQWLVEHLGTDNSPRTIVDPDAFPLGAAAPRLPPLPVHWTREAVAWTRADDSATLIDDAGYTLASLPAGARLRIADAHGTLTPALVTDLAKTLGPERLTFAPENTTGLATAAALAAPAAARVVTALLGLGPRSGYAATELLVPPANAAALRAPAEMATMVCGRPLFAAHPLWGPRRHEAAEPALLAQDPKWTPRPNPATLTTILDRHLADWDIDIDPSSRARLLAHLAARLRPGERLDGPLLYAILATHLDLKTHAAAALGRDTARDPDT